MELSVNFPSCLFSQCMHIDIRMIHIRSLTTSPSASRKEPGREEITMKMCLGIHSLFDKFHMTPHLANLRYPGKRCPIQCRSKHKLAIDHWRHLRMCNRNRNRNMGLQQGMPQHIPSLS